jgi:Transposase DDE domain
MFKAFHSSAPAAIWLSLHSKIASLARESGLVRRASKTFSPEKFLLSFLGAVSNGRASLNQLVTAIGHEAPHLNVSPQALHQRVTRSECGAESFFTRCLVQICQLKCRPLKATSSRAFKRILVEDSTFIRFPKANSAAFPGHGNASGATAGCKVDLAFDLLGGGIVHNQLHLGTAQDKTIGIDLLDEVQSGDLVLRDMGYFGIANFRVVELLGAFWLSRLPLTVDVVDGKGVALEEILGKHRGNLLDIRVKLTAEGHPVRLVAIRASKAETAKRRREHRSHAQKSGRTPPAKTLIRDGWHLLVTNVCESMQSPAELAALYSQRWQIEIIFRAWKQAGNLGEALNRKSSPQHLKALVLAGMISLTIGLVVGIQLARAHPGERYSMEKIFDNVIGRLPGLLKFDQILELAPDPRILQGQKRTRNSLCQRLMELLS